MQVDHTCLYSQSPGRILEPAQNFMQFCTEKSACLRSACHHVVAFAVEMVSTPGQSNLLQVSHILMPPMPLLGIKGLCYLMEFFPWSDSALQ